MADVVARLLLDLLDDLGDFLGGFRWCCRPLKECSKLLALLLGVGRVPRVVGRLAVEEVRHKDLVLVLLVRVRQDVGPLQCVVMEAKYIVDDEDGGCC